MTPDAETRLFPGVPTLLHRIPCVYLGDPGTRPIRGEDLGNPDDPRRYTWAAPIPRDVVLLQPPFWAEVAGAALFSTDPEMSTEGFYRILAVEVEIGNHQEPAGFDVGAVWLGGSPDLLGFTCRTDGRHLAIPLRSHPILVPPNVLSVAFRPRAGQATLRVYVLGELLGFSEISISGPGRGRTP